MEHNGWDQKAVYWDVKGGGKREEGRKDEGGGRREGEKKEEGRRLNFAESNGLNKLRENEILWSKLWASASYWIYCLFSAPLTLGPYWTIMQLSLFFLYIHHLLIKSCSNRGRYFPINSIVHSTPLFCHPQVCQYSVSQAYPPLLWEAHAARVSDLLSTVYQSSMTPNCILDISQDILSLSFLVPPCLYPLDWSCVALGLCVITVVER